MFELYEVPEFSSFTHASPCLDDFVFARVRSLACKCKDRINTVGKKQVGKSLIGLVQR